MVRFHLPTHGLFRSHGFTMSFGIDHKTGWSLLPVTYARVTKVSQAGGKRRRLKEWRYMSITHFFRGRKSDKMEWYVNMFYDMYKEM